MPAAEVRYLCTLVMAGQAGLVRFVRFRPLGELLFPPSRHDIVPFLTVLYSTASALSDEDINFFATILSDITNQFFSLRKSRAPAEIKKATIFSKPTH
ncbi:MAG: hypothetical protein CL912_07495 [Deltaproteobacteria bacterium]|nr:hypothetical protein [Deltaproteobacteria bacterium]